MPSRTITALLLCLVLTFPAGAAKAVLHQKGGGLKILVLAGANAVNYIPSRMSVVPIVEVRDDNDRPVENAKVKFSLAASGPGADFGRNKPVLDTFTNAQGQVAAVGYTANEIPGPFVVAVSAAAGQRWGIAEIPQVNSLKEPPPAKAERSGGNLKWILIGVAGAAGLAAGIIVATRGGGDAAAAASTTIGVSTGPISVGGPK